MRDNHDIPFRRKCAAGIYSLGLFPERRVSLIHPLKSRLLSTEALAEAMPDFKWNGGHSGRVLPPEYSAKLKQMWKEYLEMNNNFKGQEDVAIVL